MRKKRNARKRKSYLQTGKTNPYLPSKCKIETVQKLFKMKQTLQKITKTLLFCFVIILSSCEKEGVSTIENTEAKNNNISIKYVSGKNIPNIINKLNPDYNSTFKSNSSKSNMITDSFGSISIENILEVIDSLGNKNYSFALSPKKPKPNSIFNLVISTSDGNKNIAIVEYRMAPNFAQDYYNGTKSISEFTGSILRFPFKDASNLFSKTSGKTCIQNIDEVVNCDEIIVEGGNIIRSGGAGGSTTISDTNTYTGADGGTVTSNYSSGGGSASWVCNKYHVSHSGPTTCGDGSGTWIIILFPDKHTGKLSNPKSKTSGTSCCDDTIIGGTVGVNLFDLAVSIRDILGFSPRSQESLWLIKKATDQQITSISNFLEQNNNSTEGKAFALEIINYFIANPLNSDSATTELFFKALRATDNFQDNLTESFVQDNISYFSQDVQNQILIDPLLAAQIAAEYLIQRAVKKYLHPNWNEVQIYYSVLWDLRHMTLDAFGLIPVIGEVADLVNGTLYTIEGDKVNAAFSFASAVPVAGWAAVGVKYAVKIKTVATIGTKVKLTWKVLADGTIYFGTNNTCRAQLRKVLGLAVGNLNQAHHIIPLNLQTNAIVQKAFKSPDAFHLNEALNGIPLSTAVHNGSHFNYDGKIFHKLEVFRIANPNATPTECYNEVVDIINDIRTAIRNSPNTPINQLNF